MAGFIATGLTKEEGQVGEATEDIEVIKVPLYSLINFYLKLNPEWLFDLRILAIHELVRHLGVKS